MAISLPKIVLFGDSITEGSTDPSLSFSLPSALQHAYRRRFDVIIRGYSGITTEKLLPFFKPLVDSLITDDSGIALAIIFLGSNDAAVGFSHFVPLQSYIDNLKKMIRILKLQKTKVILVGPAANVEIADKPGRQTIVKRDYSNAVRKLAEQHSIAFIDLWHGFLTSVGYSESSGLPIPGQINTESPYTSLLSELMTDGLHFSGKGYELWYNKLLDCIRTEYPELSPLEKPPSLQLGDLKYG